MKIGMAQLNPTVGDMEGNLARIGDAAERAAAAGARLVVYSELCLTGYPPRDLLERGAFIEASEKALAACRDLSRRFPDTGLLIGSIGRSLKKTGKPLTNSAFLIRNGGVLFRQDKTLLPTYDVFDESRYFEPSEESDVFHMDGETLGITICEDAWCDAALPGGRPYPLDPVRRLAGKGATLLINLSASPFYVGKETARWELARGHATRHRLPFILVNQVGGNDELIFDGRSLALSRDGELAAGLAGFTEDLAVVDSARAGRSGNFAPPDSVSSMHDALILGIRDYLNKCGFRKAVLGLSGGIDSALVCSLAAEALGPENVLGIAMPSDYSSPDSEEDARRLAAGLGVAYRVIPISGLVRAYQDALSEPFRGTPSGAAEENIQARIRGNLLMAFSNKFGYLTLSTGNKSELSVGYCTLYGDMSGGLSVIADVPKTRVYRLAEYVNRKREIIPRRCFTRPPSAELRPGQQDQDTLPPYETLDAILHHVLEEGLSGAEIESRGFAPQTVQWVMTAITASEFKRRQAAPGLKLFPKAFGSGRRMPIAMKGIY
ncbi:NAD+ synthase [bacterium]|nr:NAD+ synthase [bacterium]